MANEPVSSQLTPKPRDVTAQMWTSEEVERTAASYLTLFERGALAPRRSASGRICVPLESEVAVRAPRGAACLLLRLALPADALAAGPQRLRFRGEGGVPLGAVELRTGETWLLIQLAGHGGFEMDAERSFADAGEEVAALLLDLEVLKGPVRSTVDLAGLRAAEDRFLTLRLDLTNKCNLRCRMCSLSFDEVFHQPKDYMEVDDFARFAREVLPHTAQLSLSAGYEPLLHPRFTDVLAEVARHDVPFVEFTTNGTLMSESLVHALIDSGVSRITVSVDGARQETYEHVRRGARFDRFKDGLEILRRVKAERGSDRPELSFQMVLLRRNVDELSDVIRLGLSYGMTVFHSVLVVPIAGLGMEVESLEGDRARANAAFADARRLAAGLGLRAQIPPDFDLSRAEEVIAPVVTRTENAPAVTVASAEWVPPAEAEAVPDALVAPEVVEITFPETAAVVARPASPAPRDFAADAGGTLIPTGFASERREARDADGAILRTSCIYPWTMAVVRPDRHVVPCCQWHDFETMGSLEDRSFEDIWNGPEYRRLRIELQAGRWRPACAQCPERRRI